VGGESTECDRAQAIKGGGVAETAPPYGGDEASVAKVGISHPLSRCKGGGRKERIQSVEKCVEGKSGGG